MTKGYNGNFLLSSMGVASFISSHSLLGCLSQIWPQYPLDNQSKRLHNSTLDLNIVWEFAITVTNPGNRKRLSMFSLPSPPLQAFSLYLLFSYSAPASYQVEEKNILWALWIPHTVIIT